MAASHGSKAVLEFGTAAAPTVKGDMSQYANSIGAQFERESAEVTTFAKGSKQYIPGLKDATIPYEGPYDLEADNVMWPLYDQGTIVDFDYYPSGKGVGAGAKFSGKMFVTSYEVSSEVGDANSMSGEFQVTGDVVRTTQ